MARDADAFDVFVSYARADDTEGWISGFIEALQAEHRGFSGGRELACFFDKQVIRSLDDWQQSIFVEGLARSRLFLAFLSPAWFASEWCRREWKAWIDTEIAKHILSSGAAAIYVVEVPGFMGKVPGLREQATRGATDVAQRVAELCGLPAPHDEFIAAASPAIDHIRGRRQVTANFVRPFADEGLAALRREDLQRALAALARDLDQRAQHIRDAANSETSVPPYNRKFSGRLDELLDLRTRLKDDQAGVICGVHGLGGIGKTELAFTYAHAFAGAYPGGRFLVPCEGQTSLRDAVLVLGSLPGFRERIGDEERKTPERHFAAVSRCLAERLAGPGHVLLVLDNVTDAGLVGHEQTDALTRLGPKLHLLATTRILSAAGGNWLTLGELRPAEALDLLEKHRPFADAAEREAAQRIVARLGGFALAVELVAAWLAAHPGHSYAALAGELGLEDLEALAGDADVELRRHNHERRLGAVLGPVLGSLQPPERRALEYAALLAPDQVPLPWLKDLVGRDFPEAVQPRRLAADPWREVCRRLERLALFSRGEDGGESPRVVRVHRLVQDLVRREMSEPARRVAAMHELVREREGVLRRTSNWVEARWEIEPLEDLALRWVAEEDLQATWLLNSVFGCWHRLAEWTRAEPLMRRALAIDEASYGKDHPRVAIYLNNLAQLLKDTNRLAEAEPLMRRALAIDEVSYGKAHPDVARDLNNLAQLLQATNRLAEVEPLMRRALAIDEASYGKDHPRVAIHLNNLAHLLQDTNRLAEAEPLMRRALAIDEASYGKDHPDVACDLNNLAQLLKATNRLGEAEPLLRRALAIDEASYGKDHPMVAIHLNNLAGLLQATNRLAEAEPLMRRALAIDEASYGKDHPRVAIQLNTLAGLLQATNRLAEAEPLMRRALAIDEASYGKDHPDVARDLNNLAQLLKDTSRLAEAEPLMRRALAIDEASYGKDHPRVAIQLNNLAQLLQATNRLAEAEPLMRRALTIDEASYGKDHPRVAIDLNNLAQLLQATNRLAEVEPLMRRALAIDEASYGKDHPDVARDLNNLGRLLRATNRLTEAEPLSRRQLEILLRLTQATGHVHPHLQVAVGNYGAILAGLGRSRDEVQRELDALAAAYGLKRSR